MLSSIEKKKMRQEKILFSLGILKFATRDQFQRLHHLGSDRNALKILGQLKDFLHVQNHQGKNVYYLNKEGRELTGIEEEMKWNTLVDHHLMRNDLYLYYNCPLDWRIEEKTHFRTSGKIQTFIPDVVFKQNDTYYFLEVDRLQSMNENKKKIERYRELSPLMKQQYHKPPVIVFYTLTHDRKAKLKQLCTEAGLFSSIFTKEDIR